MNPMMRQGESPPAGPKPKMPDDQKPARTFRRPVPIWALVALGSLLIIIALFNPQAHEFFPRCQFHRWTGLHCPGCGALRSIHEALNGEFARAFGRNPFLYLSLPLLTWLLVVPDGRSRFKHATLWRAFFLATALFWITRNLPWWPFSLLAP